MGIRKSTENKAHARKGHLDGVELAFFLGGLLPPQLGASLVLVVEGRAHLAHGHALRLGLLLAAVLVHLPRLEVVVLMEKRRDQGVNAIPCVRVGEKQTLRWGIVAVL